MDLVELQEGSLVGLNWSADALYLELRVRTLDRVLYKAMAYNEAVKPISVRFSGISLKAGFEDVNGMPSLGEIEAINAAEGGVTVEGDFGAIEVLADTWRIEAAP